ATDRARHRDLAGRGEGELAGAQGSVGGDAAERRVLRKATREGLRSAKSEAARVLATAPDADARAERIHRERSRRQWTRDGVWNLALSGPIALGAEIEACLAPFHDAAWDAAASQPKDARDTPDAIAFDSLLALARAARDGCGRPTGTKPRGRAKTRDHVVVHADLARLVAADGDGVEGRCEIPGVGPVPVAHARAMLGDGPVGGAVFTILVEHGEDVRTFARPGRNVTRRLAQLLEARSPACSITGCGRVARLENDHATPVSEGGDSTDENVDPLCRHHHRRKTDGWILTEQPDGTRTLRPPPGMREDVAA
ncbi:MAG: HNH endonuclease signature motif containing protein, partial [Acidimicrobiia bacterium]